MAPVPFEDAIFAPDFDVKETKDSFIFAADLPGIAEKDVQVELTENRLSISGTREAEKIDQGQTYYASERSFGSFTRSFMLPEGVDADKVRAELKHGVLEVVVAKRPEARSKKVPILSK
jgi:HSP20 family protein